MSSPYLSLFLSLSLRIPLCISVILASLSQEEESDKKEKKASNGTSSNSTDKMPAAEFVNPHRSISINKSSSYLFF